MKIVKNKILPLCMAVAIILSAFLPVVFAPMAVSAMDIEVDKTYNGYLVSTAATNQYQFTLSSPGSITIQFTTDNSHSFATWRVRLHDPDEALTLQTNDFGAGGSYSPYTSTKTEIGEKVRLPAGIYYIDITANPNATFSMSQYSFIVKFLAEDEEYEKEYNNMLLAANSLDFSTRDNITYTAGVSGNISYGEDLDYFKITPSTYGSLTLSFSVSSSIDSDRWVMILYDKNEKELQSERVGYGGLVSGTQRINTLSKLRLPPGTYYIKIMPYNASAISYADYKITASFVSEATNRYEKEFNNTKETSTKLSLNGFATGNISNSDDIDYFEFDMYDRGEIKIKFETPDIISQNFWTVYIMNDKGGIRTYNLGQMGVVVSGKRIFTSDAETLDEGKYYVAVYAAASRSFSNEDYTLTISSDTAPQSPEIEDDKIVNYSTEVPPLTHGVNETKQGRILSSSDTNNFDFGIIEKGAVTLKFQMPENITKKSWTANIYDANNNLLHTETVGGGGQTSNAVRTETSNKIRLPAGSYHVQVVPINSYDYSTVTYNITIQYTSEASAVSNTWSDTSYVYEYESEHNNTSQMATQLNLDKGYYMIANLSSTGDTDYYKVTLDKAGSFMLNFAAPKTVTQNNWAVKIYASDTKTLLYDSTFGADGIQDSIDELLKTKISDRLRLPKGTYYISVQAYNNITYSGEDYRLQAEYTEESDNDFEQEYNNKADTANSAVFNTDVTGNLSNSDDVDYFKIMAEKTDTIQIKFSIDKDITNNYWYVKVYDTQLKELKSYKIGGTGGTVNAEGLRYFKTEIISVLPGAYYIAVGSYSKSDYSNGEYIIKFLDADGQKIDTALSVQYTYTADEPASWAKEEVELAYAYSLIPQGYMQKFSDDITREEFCALVMQFLTTWEKKTIDEILTANQKFTDPNTFTDTKNSVTLAASALGIIKGRGNGIFDPKGKITREEAAIMLMRLGRTVNINPNETSLTFLDKDKFQPDAVDAIGYVSACVNNKKVRVMQGVPGGNFNPHGNYTRQEAYLTMIRLYFVR